MSKLSWHRRFLPGTFLAVALPFVAVGLPRLAVAAPEALRLEERFPVGYQYQVTMRTDLTGKLTPPTAKDKPPAKPLAISGDSAFEYVERVLGVDEGQVVKTARLCTRVELQRTVAERPQQNKLRPNVRRLIVLRTRGLKAPFSPDGPLLWSEIDLMRSDVFTPALAGLLPGRAVQVGDTWTAGTPAILELTGMDRVDDGRLDCKLEAISVVDRRRQARVGFSGTVRGTGEDGLNRHQVQGYLLFDLESNYLAYLQLKGVQSLLDAEGKEVGRNEGRFVLRREPVARAPELAEGLRGVALEPNAENTQLLYENPTLGVQFLHPRRWWIAGVRGPQVTLDSADGHGLLLTVEPLTKVPTGRQFLAESRQWLQDQKAKLLKVEEPHSVVGVPGLEHFALEAEMGKSRFRMEYYVLRHANGGITIAARILPADLEAVQKEVERLARSLTLTKKIQ